MQSFTLYVAPADADNEVGGRATELARLPAVRVEVDDDAPMTEALEKGGLDRYNSFALITSAIERRVEAGIEASVTSSYNLCGLDSEGGLRYQGGEEITAAEFVRAAEFGLYEGDPHRLVIYPWGAAGGWMPDGLPEVMMWIFGAAGTAVVGDLTLQGTKALSRAKFVAIRRDWRKRGITGHRLLKLLERNRQWDASHLAKLLNVEGPEARAILTQAGYRESPDSLWRDSSTPDSKRRRDKLQEIQKAVEAETP